MARSRGQSDPARTLQAVLSTFRGGATGATEALQRKQAQKEAINLLLAKEAIDQMAPEKQAQQLALEQALSIKTPQPMGGFNRVETEAGIPGKVEDAARQKRLDVLEKFGLLKTGITSLFGVDPTAGTVSSMGNVPKGSKTFLTGEQPLITVDPNTGEQVRAGTVPRGSRIVERQPGIEEEAERKGTITALSKEYENAFKSASTIRQLSLITNQFMEALPSGERTELEQRFAGFAAKIGAKTGLAPNPQLLALLGNSRLEAISLIRSFGEVGNLSQSEQEAAIQAYDQAGLTDEERVQKIIQLGEFVMAKQSPAGRRFMLKQNPDLIDIFGQLGIDITGLGKVSKPSFLNGVKKSNGSKFLGFE